MIPAGQTVCLCMIVKNEAPVIARCLASVRPLIDHWVIVDTGSTDGTQDIVRTTYADLPGALHERPWRDFARNRTEALGLARAHGTYTLVIDADDTLTIPAGFRWPALTADSYSVDIAHSGVSYRRQQVFRAALPWRYEGVLHEYPVCDSAGPPGDLPLTNVLHDDGARRRDPTTYRKDVGVLEHALETERDPMRRARYTFYLAQSWRDCGEADKAIAAYLARAEMGHWIEEVYVSLLRAGQLMSMRGDDVEQALATLARASATCPHRAEADHAAARCCRERGDHARALAFAERGLRLPEPAQSLFVDSWIYSYGLRDEFAVAAYWTGRYRACLDASLAALATGAVPPADVARIAQNARFAADRLSVGADR